MGLQFKLILCMECNQKSPLPCRIAFCRIYPNGAGIQADSVHGMQSEVALAKQNGTLQDGFCVAAIPTDYDMECNQRTHLSYRMTFCRMDSVHGKQSRVALVIQNGILQNKFSGAPIQPDYVHGMQAKVALAMQDVILQHGSSGAAIQADSVHGMQSKVALVIENGILQNRPSGAAIQADSAHGLQSGFALAMQNCILQNIHNGAAIQADPVHGMISKVA